MKRFILVVLTVCLFMNVAYADGYPEYHTAVTLCSKGRYEQAKRLFETCKASGDFDAGSLNVWIDKCEKGLQRQRQNAVAAEQRRQAKLAERKSNAFVYISVNCAESGEIFNSTKSVMSEVLRLNKRTFCPELDDALTIVSVSLSIKMVESENGFYKAEGAGTVMLGSAIDDQEFEGQWTVDCEATSVVGVDDAKRLVTNKLNHKLGYALDNLLNGRPQGSDYYIPEQSITVTFSSKNNVKDDELTILREAMNGYISSTPGMIVSTALDMAKNEERDNISKIASKYVKREGRAPVRELEGFKQRLRLSVISTGGSYTFIGEIEEITGRSLTTVTVNGADFDINDVNAANQKLIAKVLAVGLGFSKWEIGEYIGKHRLIYADGLHGMLAQVYLKPSENTWTPPVEHQVTCRYYPSEIIQSDLRNSKWRIPTVGELEMIMKQVDKRGQRLFDGRYWSCTSRSNGTHLTVDFLDGKIEDVKDNNRKIASFLLIKEF